MKAPKGPRIDLAVFVAPVLALLAFVVWRSLGWRMRHDLPMMMYQAFLMDRFGLLPYRDFFDMNMPGTYATYLLIGKVFGYGDVAMRIVDVGYMATLAAIAAALLRRGPVAAVALAGGLFLLIYLRWGGEITLQREILALVPVGLGVLAAVSEAPIGTRALLAGLAFGWAATYKPPLAIGALPVAVWLGAEVVRGGGDRRDVARFLGIGLLGVAAPIAVAVGVLAALGVLDEFRASLDYLRLYSHLTGEHRTIEGADRAIYLVGETLQVEDRLAWVIAGWLGFATAMASVDEGVRRRAALYAGLLAVYVVYPAFSGQFWPYHWLPAWFFASLGMASLLAPGGELGPWVLRRVALLFLVAQITQAGAGLGEWDRIKEHRPSGGRPDAIAKYLREHLREGETVQPFDWVEGGVVHGMLLAEARPATSFLYTFHFYHHVDDPYIGALKGRFGRQLMAAPPAYVVVSRVAWPYVYGEDTTTDFPGFDAWLTQNYDRVEFPEQGIEMWEAKRRYSR